MMAPDWLPQASIDLMTDMEAVSPDGTAPKTTWRPSSQEVTTVVMKNWEPLLSCCQFGFGDGIAALRTHVFGPALAMESMNGLLWVSLKFSSANFSP